MAGDTGYGIGDYEHGRYADDTDVDCVDSDRGSVGMVDDGGSEGLEVEVEDGRSEGMVGDGGSVGMVGDGGSVGMEGDGGCEVEVGDGGSVGMVDDGGCEEVRDEIIGVGMGEEGGKGIVGYEMEEQGDGVEEVEIRGRCRENAATEGDSTSEVIEVERRREVNGEEEREYFKDAVTDVICEKDAMGDLEGDCRRDVVRDDQLGERVAIGGGIEAIKGPSSAIPNEITHAEHIIFGEVGTDRKSGYYVI